MLIGEVCKISGLSKDTIRHYESLGLLHSLPVKAGSREYRDYDDTTLERLSMIGFAKWMGVRLRDLREPLDRALSSQSTTAERRVLLENEIDRIDRKIEELQAARRELVLLAARPEKDLADSRMKALGFWLSRS
jgi:DNA-binding transcriptional MerR regulator